MLAETPFHARTSRLVRAQTWRRWAGYQVASAYDPHPDREYAAIRNAAALFDVSPLYKYHITGRDAARLLDRMVTRDVAKCAGRPGALHALVRRRRQGHRRRHDQPPRRRHVSPHERRAERPLAAHERGRDGRHDRGRLRKAPARSRCRARSRARSSSSSRRTDLRSLKYFRLLHTTIRDIPVTISRTGYTGDLGYEIWVDAQRRGRRLGCAHRRRLAVRHHARRHLGARHRAHRGGADHARRRLLLRPPRAHPRPEVHRPTRSTSAGRSAEKKGPFNGRRALREEKARGPAWKFVGLEVDWTSLEQLHLERGLAAAPPDDRVAHERAAAAADGKQVGYATSGMLVAAAQEVPRARARRRRIRRPGHAARDRDDRRASAQARRAPRVPQAAVLRSAEKEACA